jgi:hypothetical protein
MYCPTCAAQNIVNAQFCRACGADISFLSQAMTRPEPEHEKRREQGLRYTFTGAGFLLVALIMLLTAPQPVNWAIAFAMLCAGFPLVGTGVARVLSVRRRELGRGLGAGETQRPAAQFMPPRTTSQFVKPASVTEGTTEILRVPSHHDR